MLSVSVGRNIIDLNQTALLVKISPIKNVGEITNVCLMKNITSIQLMAIHSAL